MNDMGQHLADIPPNRPCGGDQFQRPPFERQVKPTKWRITQQVMQSPTLTPDGNLVAQRMHRGAKVKLHRLPPRIGARREVKNPQWPIRGRYNRHKRQGTHPAACTRASRRPLSRTAAEG